MGLLSPSVAIQCDTIVAIQLYSFLSPLSTLPHILFDGKSNDMSDYIDSCPL